MSEACEHGNKGWVFTIPCPDPNCIGGTEHDDLRVPIPSGHVEGHEVRPSYMRPGENDEFFPGGVLFNVMRFEREQDFLGNYYWKLAADSWVPKP